MLASGWFVYLRAILEVLYFVAGIAIAAFAWYGLRQITLTKKIATTTAKREAIKFAAERCEYYANTCVPAHQHVLSEHNRLKLTYIHTPLQFQINKTGSQRLLTFTNFNRDLYIDGMNKMGNEIITLCNVTEAFAIPFAAKVADDELGYQETAAAFCLEVEQQIGMIQLLREGGARYESTLCLYERWKNRLVAESLEGQVKQMQALHRVATEKAKVPQDESL